MSSSWRTATAQGIEGGGACCCCCYRPSQCTPSGAATGPHSAPCLLPWPVLHDCPVMLCCCACKQRRAPRCLHQCCTGACHIRCSTAGILLLTWQHHLQQRQPCAQSPHAHGQQAPAALVVTLACLHPCLHPNVHASKTGNPDICDLCCTSAAGCAMCERMMPLTRHHRMMPLTRHHRMMPLTRHHIIPRDVHKEGEAARQHIRSDVCMHHGVQALPQHHPQDNQQQAVGNRVRQLGAADYVRGSAEVCGLGAACVMCCSTHTSGISVDAASVYSRLGCYSVLVVQ
jgi:hypothetical protein